MFVARKAATTMLKYCLLEVLFEVTGNNNECHDGFSHQLVRTTDDCHFGNLIQLEKGQAEDFGFVKIDILGNRSLAVVRDTLKLVETHYGTTIRRKQTKEYNGR